MRTTIPLLAIAVMLGTVPATQADMGQTPIELAQTSPPATTPPATTPPTATPPAATPPAATPAQPPQKLTGMAAWNALVGNTVVGKLEGKEFADYYLPDGTVKSMVESQIVVGKWALEGDKICFTYPTEPKECYAMEVAGDAATFTDPSGTGIRAQILKGNAKNL